MNRYTYDLLEHLKTMYLRSLPTAKGAPAWEIDAEGVSASARQFYLADLKDNLVRPMASVHKGKDQFGGGAGKELEGKMRALRSSSAMTFNLFGNVQCAVESGRLGDRCAFPAGTYGIQYEFKATTLPHASGLPAHLDVLLTGEDKAAVAFEMKLMEWLTSEPQPLRGAYLKEGSYGPGADVLARTARSLNEAYRAGAFTHYDFAQMFKHMVGLYNESDNEKLSQYKEIFLVNGVWMPTLSPEVFSTSRNYHRYCEDRDAELREFDEFKRLVGPVVDLFDGTSRAFSLCLCNACDLIGAIKKPEEEDRLLERYR